MATINGTNGNDTIRPATEGGSLGGLPNATDQADTIEGLGGNDLISAAGGSDTVTGGGGSDTILGGTGDDSLSADTVSSNSNDYLFGGEGDDTLRAAPANPSEVFNYLFGGPGNDTIVGNNDPFSWADYADRALPVVVDFAAGTAIVDGNETDTLIGVRGARGGAGDDTFEGTAAFEVIVPGLGNNVVNGNGGNDYLAYFDLGAGVDADLAAGTVIHLTDGSQDTLVGTFQILGTTFDDTLRGDDADNVFRPINGTDLVDGRGGFDTVRYTTGVVFTTAQAPIFLAGSNALPTQGVVVDLLAGTAVDRWSFTDTLVSIEAAIGSAGDDILSGDDQDNALSGVGGNDVLNGRGGNDVLDGGDGADLIRGGDGNDDINVGTNGPSPGTDIAFGESGDDDLTGNLNGNNFTHLFGGIGNDTIRGNNQNLNLAEYSDRALPVIANLTLGTATVGGTETDTLIGVRGIRAGSGNDQIIGTDFNDIILPGLGNNVASGGLGFDRISYAGLAAGVSVDLLAQTATKSGDGSTDTITDFEVIQGTNHADTLRGDNLDNELRGLAGADVLDGRDGHDTVNYNTGFSYPVGNAIFADPFTLVATGVTVNLTAGTATDNWGAADSLTSIENVIGTTSADDLTGVALTGGERSLLRGLNGNDTLRGVSQTDLSVTVDYRGSTGTVLANLNSFGLDLDGVFVAALRVLDGLGGTDTLVNIQSFRGSDVRDNVFGSDRNDRLEGEAGNDFLNGAAGDDDLRSGAGDDGLMGSQGVDTYRGGSGIDTIFGNTAVAVMGMVVNLGTGQVRDEMGNNESIPDLDVESVSGTQFADDLTGNAVSNTLSGGDGNDTLSGGAGDDDLRGGRGTDTYIGGDGYDIIRFEFDPASTQGVAVNLAANTVVDGYGNVESMPNADIEMVVGSALGDTLTGKVLADGSRQQMRGREGNDTIIALTVDTQVTADYRHGNFGTGARVNLSNADATLGGQLVQAGRALDGLGGTDTLMNIQYARGGDFGDFILGTARNDRLDGEGGNDEISGGAGNDSVRGQAGNDTLRGGDGNDLLGGGQGADTYYGGAGFDTMLFNEENDGANGVIVNLITGVITDPYGNAETIPDLDIEAAIGTNWADTIIGTPIVTFVAPGIQNLNYLQGRGGNDTIVSGAKTDLIGASYEQEARPVIINLDQQWAEVQVLPGEAQNRDTLVNIGFARGSNFDDTFIGSVDNDFMEGRAGNDTIDGAGGIDTASYFSAPAGIVADMALASQQVQDGYGFLDTLTNVENIQGSNNAADTILGDALANRLRGRGGDDELGGRAGDDRLEGGEGNDTIVAGEGNDIILGDNGDDVAVYAGPRADYRVTENNGVFTVEDRNLANGDEGADTLTAVERVHFSDGTFPILALLQNGNADAVDDSFSINPGDTITLAGPGLLGNDSDPDFDPLSVTGGTQGIKGVAIYGADGAFTYVANPAAGGTDTLYYTISDGRGSFDVAAITINIANAAPIANDDAFTIQQAGFLNALAPGLLFNDSDPDGQAIRVDAIVQGPANGFVNWTPQGRLFYEPLKPFSGTETIVYRVTDGLGGFDTATVTITVTPIPNPPAQPQGPLVPTYTQAYADPHLVTLDGLAYDFMAVGEFVAVRAVAGNPLEVQIRTIPAGDLVSSIGGVAVGIGGSRVTVSADEPATLRIDGVVTVIDPLVGPVDVGGGKVFFDGQTFTVQMPNNELVTITDRGDFLDLSVAVDGARPPAQLAGLLGNFDGDPLNDLALPNGTVLAQPVAFSELYGAFADGWRVTDANSLFDYGPGETTATYTDLNFPPGAVTIADLPADLVAAAAALVTAAGVTDPAQIENAILDLILTGNPAFVASAAQQPAAAAVAATPTNAPEPNFVGITGPLSGVLEGDAGNTPLSFTIWRTGDVSSTLAVDWDVTLGTADATDFVPGTVLNGTITFAPTETSQTIKLALAGDTGFEADETFWLTLTNVPAGVLLGAPAAPVVVVNDDTDPASPPVAMADSYTLARSRQVAIVAADGLGANDSDDGALAFSLLASPANGSVVVNADGSFTYIAAPDFLGQTSFAYRATDAGGLFADATVTLTLEERAETLTGTEADDRIFGYGLDDTINGLAGRDRLFAGSGNDTVDAGQGDDRVLGEDGEDSILGGDGNDIIWSGADDDFIDGGIGNDVLVGESGDDVVLGGTGSDRIRGQGGNDTIDAGADGDYVQGGDGDDTVNGGDGRDLLNGDAGDDLLAGDAGDDTVNGGTGNDTLLGGDGNDRMGGDAGEDRIAGGAGLDFLSGGTDADTFVLAHRQADRDWIGGFVSGEDFFEIDATLFGGGLAAGALDPSRLVVGSTPSATQPGVGTFLYDTDDGRLRWDADGSLGSGWAPVIATLTGSPSLSASDFIIV